MKKSTHSLVLTCTLFASIGSSGTDTALPSEIPADFKADTALFDHTKQKVMIPMRDGVKLLTVIWAPKRSSGPMPIVITRTPYDAEHRPSWTHRPNSPTAAAAVPLPDAPLLANGYIGHGPA